jgi:hypothetical protein
MTDETNAPRSPGLPTKHGRVIFFAIVGFFLVSLVATAIYGAFVVAKAKQDAATVDESIRLAGWWCLLYADQKDGAFPTSFEELASAAWREKLDSALLTTPPTDWPLTTVEAKVNTIADPPAALRLSKGSATIRFFAEPNTPPIVAGDGKPSLIGTIDEVNVWLTTAAKRVRSVRKQ